MDILIKNMEMPKSCDECELLYDFVYCIVTKQKMLDADFEKRNPSCPLIPVPKPIDYKTESDVLLKLWMDKIITDGEYNKIMERLNKAVVLESTT